jgi:hypothetical protein
MITLPTILLVISIINQDQVPAQHPKVQLNVQLTERHRVFESSDPGVPGAVLTYERPLEELTRYMSGEGHGANIQVINLTPDECQQVATRAVAAAEEYAAAHVSRHTPAGVQQVLKFLAIFPDELSIVDRADPTIPFCAAGTSYAFAKAVSDVTKNPVTPQNAVFVLTANRATVNHYFFHTHTAVAEIRSDAEATGNFIPMRPDAWTQVRAGYLVVYHFDTGNHIGIVKVANSQGISTVEFNTTTNGKGQAGYVCDRQRSYDNVVGFVKTY